MGIIYTLPNRREISLRVQRGYNNTSWEKFSEQQELYRETTTLQQNLLFSASTEDESMGCRQCSRV